MADFQAIGGVSATLQTLLLDRMELPDDIPSAPVTTGPPPLSSKDLQPPTDRSEDARLNLFLYRVTENGYLQNQEIPGRGSPSAFGRPPLSLNLHYLLTPYGNAEEPEKGLFDDTVAQFLLGSAMRVLHDVPIVTDQLLTVRPVSGRTILHESLRHEFEQVKLTLEPLTLEDVTKVWTALGLRYRLSAAYVVNVVQIESRRPRRFPKPVGRPISPTIPPLPTDPPSPGPWVFAVTIQTPTITSVAVRRANTAVEQPYPYANVGDTLILLGTSLSGPVTRVAFGDLIVPAAVARGDRVEAVIPDDPQLQPGARTVRVIVSDPLVPRRVFSSNDAAFMLVPFVDPAPARLTFDAASRRLTIHGTRLIGPMPGGETVIGRSVVRREQYAANPAPTAVQIVVPVPDALPATGVHAVVGTPMATDPIAPRSQTLDITIGGQARTSPVNPAASVPIAESATFLAGLIHDAGAGHPGAGGQPATPALPEFVGAHVDLWRDRGQPRLVIVPGGLTKTIHIAATNQNDTLHRDLGLGNPATVTNAAISGELAFPLPLSSGAPRLTVAMGGLPAITVTLSKPSSLAALGADLQAQIRTVGGAVDPIYGTAFVATIGSQLLVVPGDLGASGEPVTFGGTSDDATTVQELQLQGIFSVRVRVNGAESVDKPPLNAVVRLPL
jgi:Pvc16 N-terminal domain